MVKKILVLLISLLCFSACGEVKENEQKENSMFDNFTDILSDNKTRDLIILLGLLGGTSEGSDDGCLDSDFGNSAGFGDSFYDGYGYGCSLFKNKPEEDSSNQD